MSNSFMSNLLLDETTTHKRLLYVRLGNLKIEPY